MPKKSDDHLVNVRLTNQKGSILGVEMRIPVQESGEVMAFLSKCNRYGLFFSAESILGDFQYVAADTEQPTSVFKSRATA